MNTPKLTPAQLDHVVKKVAEAMAVAHYGEGADGAGYMNDARSFVGAALALQDGVAEAQDLPDPEAPAADVNQEPQGQDDNGPGSGGGVADDDGGLTDPKVQQAAVLQ